MNEKESSSKNGCKYLLRHIDMNEWVGGWLSQFRVCWHSRLWIVVLPGLLCLSVVFIFSLKKPFRSVDRMWFAYRNVCWSVLQNGAHFRWFNGEAIIGVSYFYLVRSSSSPRISSSQNGIIFFIFLPFVLVLLLLLFFSLWAKSLGSNYNHSTIIQGAHTIQHTASVHTV